MAENRRVRMTKKMMKDALLELLEENPLEKISVTNICERADVNRSTFYAYYEDIGGLLLEIENEVLSNLPVSPESAAADTDERFLAALEEFFDYVRDNKKLFRVLIIQRDNSNFSRRLVNSVMEKYKKSADLKDELLDRYAYIYCVHGVIGIMKEWINGNFPVSTGTFAKIVLEMSAKATA